MYLIYPFYLYKIVRFALVLGVRAILLFDKVQQQC